MPGPNHQPHPSPDKLKIVVAGLGHDAREQSIDAAHEDYTEYRHEKKGIKGVIRGIWATTSGGVRKRRGAVHARHEIEDTGNIFVHEGITDDEWKDMERDTITRFAEGYVDTDNGEKSEQLLDTTPEGATLKTAMHTLFEDYTEGHLDDDNFEEAKNRMLFALSGRGQTQALMGEGRVFADNLHEIAKQVKARVETERAAGCIDNHIQNILDDSEIIVGEARIGANGESKHHLVERLAEKLNGWGINEATAVTAVSAVYAVGQWSARSTLSAASRVAGISVIAGAWAGFRARAESKDEHRLLSRKHGMGQETDRGDGISKNITETLHETRPASDMIGELESMFDSHGDLRINSAADVSLFTTRLADIEARRLIGARHNIQLVQWSSVKDSAKERLQLMRLSAQASVGLRNHFDTLAQHQKENLIPSGDFDEFRQTALDAAMGAQDGNNGGILASVKEKDGLARKLYNKEFAKGFAKGAVFSALAGIALQELMAAYLAKQHGLVDTIRGRNVGAGQHTTLLEGVRQSIGNIWNGDNVTASVEHPTGNTTSLKLPDGYEVHVGKGDSFSISLPNGGSVSDIKFDADGKITAESLSKLSDFGLNMSAAEPHETVIGSHKTATHNLTPQQFVANHSQQTDTVSRDRWYAQNTPNVYDHNEQGLQLYVNKNGDFVYSIKGMAPDGSYQDGASADVHALAKSGDLRMEISVSEGTQKTPLVLQFNSNGEAVIGRNSDIGKLFSIGANGQPEFHGAYAEPVHTLSVDAKGVEHVGVFATHVGENDITTIPDTVTTTAPVSNFTYEFSGAGGAGPIDVPPVIPIIGRAGLRPRQDDPNQQPSVPPNSTQTPPNMPPRPNTPPPFNGGTGAGPNSGFGPNSNSGSGTGPNSGDPFRTPPPPNRGFNQGSGGFTPPSGGFDPYKRGASTDPNFTGPFRTGPSSPNSASGDGPDAAQAAGPDNPTSSSGPDQSGGDSSQTPPRADSESQSSADTGDSGNQTSSDSEKTGSPSGAFGESDEDRKKREEAEAKKAADKKNSDAKQAEGQNEARERAEKILNNTTDPGQYPFPQPIDRRTYEDEFSKEAQNIVTRIVNELKAEDSTISIPNPSTFRFFLSGDDSLKGEITKAVKLLLRKVQPQLHSDKFAGILLTPEDEKVLDEAVKLVNVTIDILRKGSQETKRRQIKYPKVDSF